MLLTSILTYTSELIQVFIDISIKVLRMNRVLLERLSEWTLKKVL